MRLEKLFDLRRMAQRAEQRSKATLTQLEQSRSRFLGYLESERHPLEVEGVTLSLLRAYTVFLSEQDITVETQCYYLRPLRAMFRWAKLEGLTAADPSERLKLPKIPKKVMPELTQTEMERLLRAAQRSNYPLRDRAILLVLYDTGLRAKELTGLTLGDVNWDAHQLRVMGKGGKERVVPVGFQTVKALLRYTQKERQAPAAVKALFLGRGGGPLTYEGLRQTLDRLAERAGLEHARAHVLRHSFARAYLRNGGDVFTLQQVLGHATLDMTRRYAELTLEDVQRVHQRSSPADRLVQR